MLLGRVWCSFDISRDGGDAGLCASKERFHVSLS